MTKSIGELPPRGELVWYVIKDGAHEGPYAMLHLKKRMHRGELPDDVLIWAKGWPQPLPLKVVHTAYGELPVPVPGVTAPISEPTPVPDPVSPVTPVDHGRHPVRRWWLLGTALVFIVAIWAAVTQLRAPVVLTRPSELPVEKFRHVQGQFERFTDAVPLPLVVASADYTKLWAIDRSTQVCTYQAHFFSAETQNLSGEVLSWQAQASSANHWILFERLSFVDGQRVYPGRYKMTLTRQSCAPVGVRALWQKPDQDLSVTLEVDLYAGNVDELGRRLEELARKKTRNLEETVTKNRQAWRDIEEKLRTLDAIIVQIQQNFQGLLKRELPWPQRMKRAVDLYTVRFGGFLSNFIIQNDADFNQLATLDLPQKVDILGRQALINTFAKRIGFVSMSFIERLQKDPAAPNRRDLQDWLRAMDQDLGVEREKLKTAAAEAQELSLQKLEVE